MDYQMDTDPEKASVSESPQSEASHHEPQPIMARIRTEPSHDFGHDLAMLKTGPEVIVDFDGPHDPYKPINWPMRRKIFTTLMYGFTTMGATIGTSIYSPGVEPIARHFGVSEEVSVLGVSLFLLGFGVGPLLWGPCSEMFGRKWSVLLPYFISAFFTIGSGASENIQTLLITRFFAGFFASAPVTNTGGVLRDIWEPAMRGNAMNGYVIAVCGGPTLGPIIGGAIVSSWLGWRWTEYVTAIMVFLVFFIDLFFVHESHYPTLLKRKARSLRLKQGNWALHAQHEERDVTLDEMAHTYLIRPVRILFTPIGSCMATYASFVYGLFYAQLAAFPIVFAEVRGWGIVVSQLPFLALLVGICVGATLNVVVYNRFYQHAMVAGGGQAAPEARLPPMMLGGLLLTGGFFEFSWTGTPSSIFWFVPMIGLTMFAAGFCMIFLGALNYLVDTFQEYAASAVAANTFLRSVLAAAFPLFISYMYAGIGPNWGGSVFAFFSMLLLPIPFLFYRFGRAIRARSGLSRSNVPREGK